MGAFTPASKWHLRVNLRGGPLVYLNVQLDFLRRRMTSTHEAAVRSGQTLHLFSMIFVRADSGEVGSLVADGADAIIRADKRRPADPEERGPDVLLDAEDARHLAKYRISGSGGRTSRRSTPRVGTRAAVTGH